MLHRQIYRHLRLFYDQSRIINPTNIPSDINIASGPGMYRAMFNGTPTSLSMDIGELLCTINNAFEEAQSDAKLRITAIHNANSENK